jgi:hypothetical protein
MFTEQEKLKLVCIALGFAASALADMSSAPSEIMELEGDAEEGVWGIAQEIAHAVANGKEFHACNFSPADYVLDDDEPEYGAPEGEWDEWEQSARERIFEAVREKYLKA